MKYPAVTQWVPGQIPSNQLNYSNYRPEATHDYDFLDELQMFSIKRNEY